MLSCFYLLRNNKLLKLFRYLLVDWFRGARIYPYFLNDCVHFRIREYSKQFGFEKKRFYGFEHQFPGTLRLHVHVRIICVSAEPMPSPFQLLVQFVEKDITEQR